MLFRSCCELYYKFGMLLAPFTAALTTLRHINFENDLKNNIEIQENNGESEQ